MCVYVNIKSFIPHFLWFAFFWWWLFIDLGDLCYKRALSHDFEILSGIPNLLIQLFSYEWAQRFFPVLCFYKQTTLYIYLYTRTSVSLEQLFPTGNNFAPRGHLAMSGDIFGCYNVRGRWMCYQHLVGKARDAGKHPTRHRTAPTTKNYPV